MVNSLGTRMVYLPGSFRMQTWWVLALFCGFLNLWSNAPKLRSLGGGMYIPFEICKKRQSRRGMGHGSVGDHICEHRS